MEMPSKVASTPIQVLIEVRKGGRKLQAACFKVLKITKITTENIQHNFKKCQHVCYNFLFTPQPNKLTSS